ncbi:MAG: hypothetical protein ACM3QW_05960 [Ignavibacteriales bacterium]
MQPLYMGILIFIFAILFQEILMHLVLPMLAKTGAVRLNFREEQIPVAGGITFPMTLLLCWVILSLAGFVGESGALYLVGVIGMAFLGFVDDMLGQRDSLGFRGHFKRLLVDRELTTGALKAIGGGVLAIYISLFYSEGIWELLVNILVIALFTNSMNLFDLRPGRCVKAFLLIFLPFLIFINVDYLIFIPLFGAVLSYFRYDLQAQVMMGDTGSNVLGITLGVMSVYGLGLPAKLMILIVLVALHVYTEKYSLTKTIEKYSLLREFDRLGRGD